MSCFEIIRMVGEIMRLRESLIEAIKNGTLIPWSEMHKQPSNEEYDTIVTYIDDSDDSYDEGTIICDYRIDDCHHDIMSTYDDIFPDLKIRLVKWFDEEENKWNYDVSIEDPKNIHKFFDKSYFSELFDNRWAFECKSND